jgi:hypothetical protein
LDVAVFVFKAPGPHSGEFNPFIMERVFHGAFDEITCMDWSSDSRYTCVINTLVLVLGWVGRMFKWDCFLMGIYIASAKVGPGVNWRGFLGVSRRSLGGIILQRFGNWSSITVGFSSGRLVTSLGSC